MTCCDARAAGLATSSTWVMACCPNRPSKTSSSSSRPFTRGYPPVSRENSTAILCMAYGSPGTEARRAGVEQLIGLPLAPHYARMSLGGYQRSLREAWDRELVFVPGFHDHPAFIRAVQGLLEVALANGRPERLFFTAHSLPAWIIATGDPYHDQLIKSCRLVASGADLP